MDGYRHSVPPLTTCPGHGLIEIITVFAVIATVAALALPALGSFLREQRLISWTYTLMGDLSLARSESIKRGVPVVMCRTVDGSSCHRHRGFRSASASCS